MARDSIPQPDVAVQDDKGNIARPWYDALLATRDRGVSNTLGLETVNNALAGKQPLNANLSAIATLIGSGFLRRTTGGQWVLSDLTPDDIPNPFATYLVDHEGNYLTDPDGNYLVSDDGIPVPAEYGGTGQAAYNAGDLLYASDTDSLSRLAVGSAAQLLTVSGGLPSWQTYTGLEVLTSNKNYYVATTGSDSNSGLTPGAPFLTIQKAVNESLKLDTRGLSVVVNIAAGTYTAGATVSQPLVGGGLLLFLGAGATTIISTTNANCFVAQNAARIRVDAVKMQTTTSGSCLFAWDYGFITWGAVEFGACAGDHVLAFELGKATCDASYTVSGGATQHWHAFDNSTIVCQNKTVTITGTPALTRWAGVANCATIEAEGNTYSGAATGARFLVHKGSIINVTGGSLTSFPGSTAGEQYAFNSGHYVTSGAAPGTGANFFRDDNTYSKKLIGDVSANTFDIDVQAGLRFTELSWSNNLTKYIQIYWDNTAAAATINTNGAYPLSISTNGAVRQAYESDGNIGFHAAGSYGSGVKVMFIGNATTAPTTNPTGGGILYVESGALKFKGSSGTVTTIAPA